MIMWPSFWATSVGTKALIPLITPMTFTSSDQRQSLTWCSQKWPSEPDPIPALLQTTWTAPKASRVASRKASTDSSEVTSVTTPMTSRPAPTNSEATLTASGTISAMTTFIPSAAKRPTMALPMPPAPPVTTATLPLKSFNSRPLSVHQQERVWEYNTVTFANGGGDLMPQAPGTFRLTSV